MKRVFFETLSKYEEHISFHTPGHSGVLDDFSKLDISELPYSDNLLEPKNIIKDLQAEIAKAYGTKHVYISTSGATTLVHVAVNALKSFGPFLVLDPSHKSVFSSLRLNKIKAYVMYDDRADNLSYAENLYEEIRNNIIKTGAKVLFLTTPNYFGYVISQAQIKKIKDEFDIKIILDVAHGSHFIFSSLLPEWDYSICDVVIHSIHKTMPAATSAAIMHVAPSLDNIINFSYQDLHTTSPSYPILLSVEKAIYTLLKEGEASYKGVFDCIEKMQKTLSNVYEIFKNDDRTRLLINTPNGNKAREALEKNNIFIEMQYGNILVLIITRYNCMYLEQVASVLNEVQYETLLKEKNTRSGETKFQLRELEYANEYELINLSDAIGKKSAREVGFYPPGTPTLYSGQKIEEKDVLLSSKKDVFGLRAGQIYVFRD